MNPRAIGDTKRELVKTRMLYYIGICVLFLAFILVCLVSYWVIFPYDALDIKKIPLQVSRVPTRPNEVIVITFNYCKKTDADGRVEVSMLSKSTAIFIPISIDRSLKGCNEDLKIPVIVPSQASDGTYHFHYKVTYQVNPIKEVVEEFDTQEFEVKN